MLVLRSLEKDKKDNSGLTPLFYAVHWPMAIWSHHVGREPIYKGKSVAEKNCTFWDVDKDGIITESEEGLTAMAKLGSEKKPVVVRVHTDEMARYVAETCAKNGWHYIIGFEPDKPEDISDLEKLLNPPQLVRSEKIGRNDPCPCGSGKKYKKCCGRGDYRNSSQSD